MSNGYDGLQGVIPTLQEKIISSSCSEIEREKLKCLVENIRWEPTLSAMGYFEINRGTLVSMISIRESIFNNQKQQSWANFTILEILNNLDTF